MRHGVGCRRISVSGPDSTIFASYRMSTLALICQAPGMHSIALTKSRVKAWRGCRKISAGDPDSTLLASCRISTLALMCRAPIMRGMARLPEDLSQRPRFDDAPLMQDVESRAAVRRPECAAWRLLNRREGMTRLPEDLSRRSRFDDSPFMQDVDADADVSGARNARHSAD